MSEPASAFTETVSSSSSDKWTASKLTTCPYTKELAGLMYEEKFFDQISEAKDLLTKSTREIPSTTSPSLREAYKMNHSAQSNLTKTLNIYLSTRSLFSSYIHQETGCSAQDEHTGCGVIEQVVKEITEDVVTSVLTEDAIDLLTSSSSDESTEKLGSETSDDDQAKDDGQNVSALIKMFESLTSQSQQTTTAKGRDKTDMNNSRRSGISINTTSPTEKPAKEPVSEIISHRSTIASRTEIAEYLKKLVSLSQQSTQKTVDNTAKFTPKTGPITIHTTPPSDEFIQTSPSAISTNNNLSFTTSGRTVTTQTERLNHLLSPTQKSSMVERQNNTSNVNSSKLINLLANMVHVLDSTAGLSHTTSPQDFYSLIKEQEGQSWHIKLRDKAPADQLKEVTEGSLNQLARKIVDSAYTDQVLREGIPSYVRRNLQTKLHFSPHMDQLGITGRDSQITAVQRASARLEFSSLLRSQMDESSRNSQDLLREIVGVRSRRDMLVSGLERCPEDLSFNSFYGF
ncbi:hypothetical protein TREMEDRAFT_61520 [Tremella mesenterica DSM 1558]|uniref:uncharacterized protein n=1 Tax=Tremella mesenterica (strain ATCC 24925 / CBS 8224 / DSM 1558 / NBRC 9311 / NRRL Y-6157 / RJB 2259-6 / UBC 559-6) TaxID=578456 RepID=UPI0003F49A4A|nr:uncharacterized protein TREMEDRAFT_61520 [Tremella mesenterica DSM 1558]EIW69756.1 hypothetical protein TREMEDRAFT_61520 [Tremella mesenterica DSM 1558]